MPQLFPAKMNVLARISLFGVPFLLAGLGWGGLVFTRSSYGTGMRQSIVQQPIPFSHQHHAGVLGIDCRYCHTSVENSPFAGMPPTKTCMNCHSQIWVGSSMLEPVRESYRTRRVAALAPRLQPAGLRLFRPQHPRAEGRRLLDVPRAGRPDALHVPGADAVDGVVPRLPPQSGRADSPARRGVQHEIPAARQSSSNWGESSSSNTTSRIPPVSPVARYATDEPRKQVDCSEWERSNRRLRRVGSSIGAASRNWRNA